MANLHKYTLYLYIRKSNLLGSYLPSIAAWWPALGIVSSQGTGCLSFCRRLCTLHWLWPAPCLKDFYIHCRCLHWREATLSSRSPFCHKSEIVSTDIGFPHFPSIGSDDRPPLPPPGVENVKIWENSEKIRVVGSLKTDIRAINNFFLTENKRKEIC